MMEHPKVVRACRYNLCIQNYIPSYEYQPCTAIRSYLKNHHPCVFIPQRRFSGTCRQLESEMVSSDRHNPTYGNTVAKKKNCTVANKRIDLRATRVCATCHHITSRFRGSTRESCSPNSYGKLVVCRTVQKLQKTRYSWHVRAWIVPKHTPASCLDIKTRIRITGNRATRPEERQCFNHGSPFSGLASVVMTGPNMISILPWETVH